MAYMRRRKTNQTTKKNTSPLEKDEQMLLFEWAEYASITHPELAMMFAIPNGEYRPMRTAHSLHLQGVKAGVPDICLPIPRGGHGALYIELKRKRGGVVSEQQRAWIAALNRVGNKAIVCKGFDEAKQAIEEYLNS